MAALYYYFRLAYKHLLHGNKIMTCRLAYRSITAVFFLFFFFFFFSLVLHQTRTANVLTRHPFMQALFLSQF